MDQPTRSIEHWKPVVGYEGIYEVSDQGQVRRVAPAQRTHPGLILRHKVQQHNGRHSVTLRRDGKNSTRYVHRLVLEAFVGPCPPGMEACHWDDNPENNALENLRWDTSTANKHDCVRNGHNVNASKTHCPQGHPYDEANTYIAKTGYRHCRACVKERSRQLRARWKAEGLSPRGKRRTAA